MAKSGKNKGIDDVTATTDVGVADAGGSPVSGFGAGTDDRTYAAPGLPAFAGVPGAEPRPVQPAPIEHPELAPLLDEQGKVAAACAKVQQLAADVHAMEAALESLIRDQKTAIAKKTQELREAIDARQKLRAPSQVEAELAAKKRKLGM